MPSIHPSFEYDIFISYRQNDNRSDKWVSNFVNSLKEELEATLKNPVSIYFDENPHDGLLETHQVDASLAKKLKCLIFIPIISQTYCDESSFAWEHEFMPFINMAKEDELGMNITLSNGNVVSRVLPVKIHDLDADDLHTLEAVLDGPLRSIDFIYSEPGVNRPLDAHDNEEKNLNKTLYKNQINKVANALKDLGLSILKTTKTDTVASLPDVVTNTSPGHIDKNKSKTRSKLILPLALITVLLIAFFLFKPMLFGEKVDKKISEVGLAIMPFKNIANDPDISVLSFALKDEIHDVLALSKKFAFLSSSQATARYLDKSETPQTIGEELGVDYVLSGSYQISGKQLSVRVEFADAETGNSVWSNKFIVPYEEANILPLQADIAQKVLAIFDETGENELQATGTINLEAYIHYINGKDFFNNGWHNEKAIDEFEKSIKLDSTLTQAWIYLIEIKSLFLFTDQAHDSIYLPQIEEHLAILSKNHPQWAIELAKGIYQYRALGNYEEGFNFFLKVIELYPDNMLANVLIAESYLRKFKTQLAYKYYLKSIDLDPGSANQWAYLSIMLRLNGDYKRELQVFEKALELGLDSGATFSSNLIGMYNRTAKPLDNLPKKYQTVNSKRFALEKIWSLNNPRNTIELTKNIPLDSSPGPNNYTKTEYYRDMALAYQALYLDDSANYYAKLCIAENEQKEEKKWFWVAQSYFMLGNIEKGEEIIKEEFSTVDTEDLLVLAGRETLEIRFLVLAKKYAEATTRLLEFNKKYSEWGDFYFLTRTAYDRAKKEYPPFAEAVANLKFPEPLVQDNQLERLKY